MTSITGDKELLQKLDRLEKRTTKGAIRKGTRQGAKIVQQATKSTVPVKSGALKRAIKVRAMKARKGTIGTRCTISMPGDSKANWFYGSFQEYGWTTVNGRKVAGKHFMKQASSQSGQKALDTALNTIKDEILKAVK
jgi:HK97 gp10 family phage protein